MRGGLFTNRSKKVSGFPSAFHKTKEMFVFLSKMFTGLGGKHLYYLYGKAMVPELKKGRKTMTHTTTKTETTEYKGHTITRTSTTTDYHTRTHTLVRHIHTIEGPVLNAPVSRLVPSISEAKRLITNAISMAEFDAWLAAEKAA